MIELEFIKKILRILWFNICHILRKKNLERFEKKNRLKFCFILSIRMNWTDIYRKFFEYSSHDSWGDDSCLPQNIVWHGHLLDIVIFFRHRYGHTNDKKSIRAIRMSLYIKREKNQFAFFNFFIIHLYMGSYKISRVRQKWWQKK